MNALHQLFDWLLALPWWQSLPAVWIGSILLMFPVFYVAMAGFHFVDWMHECVDDAQGNALIIVRCVLAIPAILTVLVISSAAAYDWLINHTSAVLLFWDRPREALITGRLERYQNSADGEYGWRKGAASLLCRKCLDWADPSGRHCK